jgi:hypothetical protein
MRKIQIQNTYPRIRNTACCTHTVSSRRREHLGNWQVEEDPLVKVEEEKMVDEMAAERRDPSRLTPTLDERRFLETCRSLGEKPNKKHHYGVLGAV